MLTYDKHVRSYNFVSCLKLDCMEHDFDNFIYVS